MKNASNNQDVQNRFTAYLVTAVKNKKIKYLQQKTKVAMWEYAETEQKEPQWNDFEGEFAKYISVLSYDLYEDIQKIQELLWFVDSRGLLKQISKLKDRECKILFARVFGEMSFFEIADHFSLAPKQVEQIYYYVLRKLRKDLEEE